MSNPDYIDVDAIQKAMDDPLAGGTAGAYRKLQDEFFEAQRTLDTSSMQKHWAETIQELQERGMLNDLTLAYTAEEFEKLAGGDGKISRSDVRQAQKDDPFAAPFVGEWLEKDGKKDMLQRVANNKPDFKGSDQITRGDLNAELKKLEGEKKREYEDLRGRQAMQPLFEDGLFTELDSGKANGKVTKKEMKEFLDRYKDGQYSEDKAHLYDRETARFVEGLLSKNIPEVSKGMFKGFSTNELARKGDFDKADQRSDFEVLEKNYELRRDEDIDPLDEIDSPGVEQNEAQDGERTENEDEIENSSNFNFNPEWATNAEFEDMFRVRKGEGYSHVAKRILEASGMPVNRGEMMALTFQLMEMNGNRMLHPNDRVADVSHIIELTETSPAFARSYGHILTQYERQRMLDM